MTFSVKIIMTRQSQPVNNRINNKKAIAHLKWWAGLSPAIQQQISNKTKRRKMKEDRRSKLTKIRMLSKRWPARSTKSWSNVSLHTKACSKHTIKKSRVWPLSWSKLSLLTLKWQINCEPLRKKPRHLQRPLILTSQNLCKTRSQS